VGDTQGAVRLERTFHADINRVFRALTAPAELVRWWGPMNVLTSVAEIDLRVGGECRWVMHPGGETAVLYGRIVDLDPPRLLVMTNRWNGQNEESLVTLRLTSVSTGTHLELVHERLPAGEDPQQYRQGWEAALASLTRYLTQEGPAMPTDDTARVARAYYDAWSNRKGAEALRKVIDEEFVFDSALMHIEGREKFLAGAGAGGWPERAVTTLLAEAYDGEHAFQLYAATNGAKTVKIADHLIVRDGQLVSSEVIVDSADFMAFMAG
jgi:uncharacterized protein YndB with AHSA1/START domain